MKRNRFNQAKHHMGKPLLGETSTSISTNNLTLIKARGLFLDDNHNIIMKDTYKITNVHTPTDEKDVVNKEYCHNNLLSFSNKIDILSRNITDLRKGDFDKVTTKTLQLTETQVNYELINAIIGSANEVTNTVKFCNKVDADTISKYNQIKQEFDNNKFNQDITNIQQDEMFTTGLKEFKEVNKNTNSFIDEALLKNKKRIVHYIIAILLRRTLVDNKEQERLEKHYGFKQEDIRKKLKKFLLIKITEIMTNPTAPSERSLYPDLSSVSDRPIREVAEKQINEKIQANNKFNNNINIIKDFRNYYET